MDILMLMASQEYEASVASQQTLAAMDSSDTGGQNKDRFPIIVEEEELEEIVSEAIPEKTKQHTKWCYDTWRQWHSHRTASATSIEETPPTLTSMKKEQLNFWLSRFLVEVRRKDGSVYHGETLHSLICGLQRHLRLTRPDFVIDFMSGPEFRGMRDVLDAQM